MAYGSSVGRRRISHRWTSRSASRARSAKTVGRSGAVGRSATTARPGSTTSTSSTGEWGDRHGMTILRGEFVRLRPATLDDVPELARIRATPEVHRHWRGGENMVAAVLEDFREQDSTAYA